MFMRVAILKTKLSNDMKSYFECVIVAGRESNNEGFINWLLMKLDHNEMGILQRAAVIYAEQSNSHKPVVVRGGAIEAQSVPLEGEALKWTNSSITQITPTEPLPAEGSAKSVCGCHSFELVYKCSKCDEISLEKKWFEK